HRIDPLALKGVDVLALLLLIGYIEDGILMLLLIFLQAVLKGQILALQVLKEDIIPHLLRKLLVLDVAELDEGSNVIPVFLIVLTLGLAHSGKLVRHRLSI